MTKLNKEQRAVIAELKTTCDKKTLHKILKRYVKNKTRDSKDPYDISLMEQPRVGNASYDGYTKYGLYEMTEDQKQMTDEELRDLIYETFAIPAQHSPYDCTGKAFTEFISFHKNPCGLLSIVHHIGYDV